MNNRNEKNSNISNFNNDRNRKRSRDDDRERERERERNRNRDREVKIDKDKEKEKYKRKQFEEPPNKKPKFNPLVVIPPQPKSLLKPYDPANFLSFLGSLSGNENQKPKTLEPEKNDLLCSNPLCNHKTLEEDSTPIVMPEMTIINDINDLITLGKTYHCKKNKEFNNINLRLLCNLVPPLTELSNLIGMKSVKEGIVNQILFFIQGFNKNERCNKCVDCSYKLPCAKNTNDMLHTVISGPPGVGKTELGKILGKVYKEMGVLSKGHFTLVTRSDLIGKYLGHTAEKTQAKINECLGGVMFLDEGYALGSPEGRDSFSKECIDTINQNLTEKRDLLVIIAGYEEQLEKCFFKMNEGLNRRFTFRHAIDNYTGSELMDIFLGKLKLANWDSEYETLKLQNFFETNINNFPNFGGDVETLFLNAKIHNSKRMIFSVNKKLESDKDKRRMLSQEDIEKGYETYLLNRKYNTNSDTTYNSLWI